MPRKPIELQIEQLEARTRTLKARLASQERSRDTRRKILLGALVLHRLEHDTGTEFSRRLADWLRRELPGFLSRDQDRDLFSDLLNPVTRSDQKDSAHGQPTGNANAQPPEPAKPDA